MVWCRFAHNTLTYVLRLESVTTFLIKSFCSISFTGRIDSELPFGRCTHKAGIGICSANTTLNYRVRKAESKLYEASSIQVWPQRMDMQVPLRLSLCSNKFLAPNSCRLLSIPQFLWVWARWPSPMPAVVVVDVLSVAGVGCWRKTSMSAFEQDGRPSSSGKNRAEVASTVRALVAASKTGDESRSHCPAMQL